MRISAEGKIGIGLGLFALAGGGALVVAPAPWITVIGWAMIAAALIGAAMLATHHFATIPKSEERAKDRRMIPLVGMIVCAAGFICFASWYFWPTSGIARPGSAKTAAADDPQRPNDDGRRAAILSKLRHEYILSHDGISPALAAGLENPPDAWVNERLQQLGEKWQVVGGAPVAAELYWPRRDQHGDVPIITSVMVPQVRPFLRPGVDTGDIIYFSIPNLDIINESQSSQVVLHFALVAKGPSATMRLGSDGRDLFGTPISAVDNGAYFTAPVVIAPKSTVHGSLVFTYSLMKSLPEELHPQREAIQAMKAGGDVSYSLEIRDEASRTVANVSLPGSYKGQP